MPGRGEGRAIRRQSVTSFSGEIQNESRQNHFFHSSRQHTLSRTSFFTFITKIVATTSDQIVAHLFYTMLYLYTMLMLFSSMHPHTKIKDSGYQANVVELPSKVLCSKRRMSHTLYTPYMSPCFYWEGLTLSIVIRRHIFQQLSC